jgi:hypothetical protein
MAKVVLLDTPAAHFDAGFCNGLMMLGSWIRDNERPTAQTKRILEMITELAGEPKHEN